MIVISFLKKLTIQNNLPDKKEYQKMMNQIIFAITTTIFYLLYFYVSNKINKKECNIIIINYKYTVTTNIIYYKKFQLIFLNHKKEIDESVTQKLSNKTKNIYLSDILIYIIEKIYSMINEKMNPSRFNKKFKLDLQEMKCDCFKSIKNSKEGVKLSKILSGTDLNSFLNNTEFYNFILAPAFNILLKRSNFSYFVHNVYFEMVLMRLIYTKEYFKLKFIDTSIAFLRNVRKIDMLFLYQTKIQSCDIYKISKIVSENKKDTLVCADYDLNDDLLSIIANIHKLNSQLIFSNIELVLYGRLKNDIQILHITSNYQNLKKVKFIFQMHFCLTKLIDALDTHFTDEQTVADIKAFIKNNSVRFNQLYKNFYSIFENIFNKELSENTQESILSMILDYIEIAKENEHLESKGDINEKKGVQEEKDAKNKLDISYLNTKQKNFIEKIKLTDKKNYKLCLDYILRKNFEIHKIERILDFDRYMDEQSSDTDIYEIYKSS